MSANRKIVVISAIFVTLFIAICYDEGCDGGILSARTASAGPLLDFDMDGVPDEFDNCVEVPNGPFGESECPIPQYDGDMDGYGNACDGDFDQDGRTGGTDLLALSAAYGTGPGMPGFDPAMDINCNEVIGSEDLVYTLRTFGMAPGRVQETFHAEIMSLMIHKKMDARMALIVAAINLFLCMVIKSFFVKTSRIPLFKRMVDGKTRVVDGEINAILESIFGVRDRQEFRLLAIKTQIS